LESVLSGHFAGLCEHVDLLPAPRCPRSSTSTGQVSVVNHRDEPTTVNPRTIVVDTGSH
jgi:hypothetical protein